MLKDKSDVIIPHGKVSRIKANIQAITFLKKIEDEKRPATPEEKKSWLSMSAGAGLPKKYSIPITVTTQGIKLIASKRKDNL